MALIKLAGTLIPYLTGSTGAPSHISKFGLGGLKLFDTITDRNSIGNLRLLTGSIAYVKLTNKYYMWSSSAWTVLPTFDPNFSSGNSWKTQYRLTQLVLSTDTYSIYTTSQAQYILNYLYLSVFINGDILLQSKSGLADWDYRQNGTDLDKIIFRYNIPVIGNDKFYLTYIYNGGDN